MIWYILVLTFVFGYVIMSSLYCLAVGSQHSSIGLFYSWLWMFLYVHLGALITFELTGRLDIKIVPW
jgi:hypothetical protein